MSLIEGSLSIGLLAITTSNQFLYTILTMLTKLHRSIFYAGRGSVDRNRLAFRGYRSSAFVFCYVLSIEDLSSDFLLVTIFGAGKT